MKCTSYSHKLFFPAFVLNTHNAEKCCKLMLYSINEFNFKFIYTVTQPTTFWETNICLMLCEIQGFHDRHQSSSNKNEQQDAKNNTEL